MCTINGARGTVVGGASTIVIKYVNGKIAIHVVTETVRTPIDHPFVHAPHRTLLSLSFPVLLSLIAEPLTGLVDTAFVAQLGAAPLAALGVGTMALSGIFWIFSFLMIGTQTEVAQASGRNASERAQQVTSLALMLCALIGTLLIVLVWPTANRVASALGATDAVHTDAVQYMQIRLLGAPAVLAVMTILGALRGQQDMRSALWIAAGINIINILLDPLLIHGWRQIPAMGVGGAALASVISQWIGAMAALAIVARAIGFSTAVRLRDLRGLLTVGRDLFIRTGVLLLFLMFTTRTATRLGAESGAAHQAIRQVYVFTALFLEAFATTAQSLVGYFLGSRRMEIVRRVVVITTGWSVVTGVVLSVVMWGAQDWVAALLVPSAAYALFVSAWLISVLTQPLNALAFISDGVLWGAGDYAYMRNAMIVSSAVAAAALWLVDNTLIASNPANGLIWIWLVTGLWIIVRSIFGMARIWPGFRTSLFAAD